MLKISVSGLNEIKKAVKSLPLAKKDRGVGDAGKRTLCSEV